ncbi:helix-turn-helix transcriptional regulator [Vibrio fluvialis]|uniref:helix-turn-helix domain-containing protein n=1 Tax=Vibrio fluvialis TaxID=676 RepID=UPI00192C5585|nr:helix-turn-helix transcriptional regulator [Vibrio fluvialis]MBL4265723.1 helix-turn-helix transcriptional regulator [Vibrio fluvialis]MBL4270117.1 helix-turn-helix transcriptional regulator [Vibrio fluvialis]
MNNISLFRSQAGISQSKLGELVGVIPSTIGNYESGIRSVNINMGWKIVNAFSALGIKCQFTEVFPNPSGQEDTKIQPDIGDSQHSVYITSKETKL